MSVCIYLRVFTLGEIGSLAPALLSCFCANSYIAHHWLALVAIAVGYGLSIAATRALGVDGT